MPPYGSYDVSTTKASFGRRGFSDLPAETTKATSRSPSLAVAVRLVRQPDVLRARDPMSGYPQKLFVVTMSALLSSTRNE
jgi:hypothetical protein